MIKKQFYSKCGWKWYNVTLLIKYKQLKVAALLKYYDYDYCPLEQIMGVSNLNVIYII